jgi:hypothetical protein
MPDTPRPHRQPSPRRLFATAIAAAVVCFVFTLSFGFADHAPAPHGVRIAVAAPAGIVQHLTTGLAHAAPGAFTVVAAPSARAAIGSVRSLSAAGGLVTGVTGPVTIVTAGAAGLSQQQAITAALTAAATALHRPARPLDVVPLPAGDRAGLSAFVFEIGLLIPSVIAGVGLFLLGRRFRVWWRVAAVVLFALLAACGSVLVLDAIFGALTGASAALIGIGFLGAFTFVAFVTACQAVTGLPGTGLAALAFVFVGNAVSGGTVPFAFLPDGFRQIAPWLPNGAIVAAARDVGTSPRPVPAIRCSSSGSGWPGRWPCWPASTCCTWPNAAARRNGRPRSMRRRARHTCGEGSHAGGQRPALRWAAELRRLASYASRACRPPPYLGQS